MQKVKNHSYKECLQVVRGAAFYFAPAEKKQINLVAGAGFRVGLLRRPQRYKPV